MKTAKSIRVFGRVQGVAFRYSTHRTASMMGIKGFVKNMPDGSVYIEAEGTPEQMAEFIDWCKKGPSLAHVVDIQTNDTPIADFEKFTIR